MRRSKRSYPPPSPGQLIKTGHAILVKDKLSSAQIWHTFGKGDKKGILLKPNEPLVLRTNIFKLGTRVDVYERVEK